MTKFRDLVANTLSDESRARVTLRTKAMAKAVSYDPGELFSEEDQNHLCRVALLLRDLGYKLSGDPDRVERIAGKIGIARYSFVTAAIAKALKADHAKRLRAAERAQ